MADLTTLTKIKLHLNIAATDTTYDDLLKQINTQVSAWVESYCDRTLTKDAEDRTELYDGDGTAELFVRQWPIISVTSIHDDTARAFGASALIAATNYVLYKNRALIKLDGLVFSRGIQNVQVKYKAGYDAVPDDLQLGVTQLISKAFRHRELEGVKSLTIGAYSISFDPGKDELPDEVRVILEGYRRRVSC